MNELSVCIGSSCHLKGSYNIIQTFQTLIEDNRLHEKIELKAAFCMKRCSQAHVSVTFNGESYNVAPETAGVFFKETIIPHIV